MTAISKNIYLDVLDDVVNRTKMKPIDVISNSYAEYNESLNKKDPKFRFGDHVRISK